ncbi:DUF1616 domain-containing protein [Halosolutus amylolyticus]|uniref:DUF1616 domain-containing protein n=1 Tax=Halosolutus amylolyticus TaxID=2932267 RepID=A0ABD5PMV6_9EURY|nr:DUF1616 domain-containing protein [Halosolutus amylolyticus]
MSHRTNTWTRFERVRQYPIDLAIVSVAALLAFVVISNLPDGSTLRLAVAIPVVVFLPGYALVSLLFPAAARDGGAATTRTREQRPRGIDAIERVGLAIPLSLGIVALLALALPWTDWGFDTASSTAGLVVATVGLAQLGVVRRLRTPQSKRFTVSPLAALGRLRGTGSGRFRLSSVVLVVAIGVATGALVLALLSPASAGGFTELGLYTENEEGDLVAGELPDEVAPGESIPVTISIENQEGDHEDYTVVVQQQTVEDGEVVEREQLREIDATVADGSTGTGEQGITPTAAPGETVRISVLLYDEAPPAEPTNENALEDTYFWVTVTTE